MIRQDQPDHDQPAEATTAVPPTDLPHATAPPDGAAPMMALLRRLHHLPPLPRAATNVLGTLADQHLQIDACVQLIETDPALAAGTLRLANSAFYGAPRRVTSLGDAVRLLGLRTTAALLAAVAVQQAWPTHACDGFDHHGLWARAIATALAARRLAPASAVDPDEAFLAGLLLDMGELVLASAMPLQAGPVWLQAQRSGEPRWQAERTRLGLDHAQVGALTARQWGFPDSIVHAIAAHHLPDPPPEAVAATSPDGSASLARLLRRAVLEAEQGPPTGSPSASGDVDLDETAAHTATQQN